MRFIPSFLAIVAAALCPAAGQVPAAAAASAARGDGPVVVVPIQGELDEAMVTLTMRAIRVARERQARSLVFEIDSEGGNIGLMDRLIDEIERASDLPTVAFVTQKAASAGALIAISCERLYMKPATNIGSAVPLLITMFGDEGPGGSLLLSSKLPAEYEKISSHLRAHFRSKAQYRGRNAALAEAMTDPGVGAFEIEEDGARTIVNEREYRERVDEHGAAAVRKLREICPLGKVLNLTAQEAREYGFIDGIAVTREELLEQLRAGDAPVVLVNKEWTDVLAQFTRTFGWLLIGIGLVSLFVELKVPGFGIPGLLGIACIAVFLAGNYVAGAADWSEILLVVLGFGLVAVEVFVLPGTLLPGLVGLIAIVAGLVLASQTTLLPESDKPLAEAVYWGNVRMASLVVVAVVAAMLFIAWAFPNIPILNRAVLKGSLGPIPASAVELQLPNAGARGTAKTALKPSGKVVVDGREFDASSEGPFIDAGSTVTVQRGAGNHLIVRLDRPATSAGGGGPG
jgi:membrane-bound serine protease (ClpP class)